jgi:hypothetical protein
MFGENLEEFAPPQGLLGRLALGDVHGKVVRQPRRVELVPDQGQIEQGSGHDLILDNPTLAEVQPARAYPGDGFRALH